MIIEIIETILVENCIFSYEYNKIENYLLPNDTKMVSTHSRQLELIKITNAFISQNINYSVDEEYGIKILD